MPGACVVAGLPVAAQIGIAVAATLAGVLGALAAAWALLAQRRRRRQPTGATLFANGAPHSGVRRSAAGPQASTAC
jgi:membrane associated rhomboid family serine protease